MAARRGLATLAVVCLAAIAAGGCAAAGQRVTEPQAPQSVGQPAPAGERPAGAAVPVGDDRPPPTQAHVPAPAPTPAATPRPQQVQACGLPAPARPAKVQVCPGT